MRHVLLLLCCLLPLWLQAQKLPNLSTVTIPATANVFTAGLTSIQQFPHKSPGTLAPSIDVKGYSKVVFAVVTGTVSCMDVNSGADGGTCAGGDTQMEGFACLSGITHHGSTMFLAGVFLPYACDNSLIAPPALDFTLNTDFLSLSPKAQQVFFIGDGQTTTGQQQVFHVPQGARYLYLGFVDGYEFRGVPSYYDNNKGSLEAIVSVE